MGEFLARVAGCGIQIIVETHSDHVLNGARKAVKNKIINHEQVAIHYFTPKEDVRVVSPLIDKNGNLDSWPEGFFDQFDVDTSSLIGWSNQDDVSSK
jgi:predicted ATPase